MHDRLAQPATLFTSACTHTSILNRHAPTQVYLYQHSNVTRNGQCSDALYANDSWQVNRRLTLNLGVRYDRQRAYLPDQQGPTGQDFTAVDSAVVWNNWGPRLGLSLALSGDGKTLVTSSFGQFSLYPA